VSLYLVILTKAELIRKVLSLGFIEKPITVQNETLSFKAT
jgi:hypothetical protein